MKNIIIIGDNDIGYIGYLKNKQNVIAEGETTEELFFNIIEEERKHDNNNY